MDPNEKDARLTVKDIQRLRRQHVPLDQIVDNVAEQGRAFEVTADVARQLRRLGFRPAQIDAIKEAATEPLVPGKSLTDDDEEKLTQEVAQVRDGAEITVWRPAGMTPFASGAPFLEPVMAWATKRRLPK